jgi:glycosyltransferase involved in cell wall biosynthesis
MHPPLITVLMAVHDGESYLRTAIDSILAQSFTDFEFLVIDDCSQDDTPAILRSYNDARIRVVRNPTRLRLTASLNLGLEMAKGRFIARQDADDLSFPLRLGRQVAYLMNHPGTALLGTWANLLDQEGSRVGELCPALNGLLLKWVMLFNNRIIHSSVVFDKEKVMRLGGYSSSLPIAQDYDLWCRIMKTHPIAIVPEKLLELRLHPESISAKQKETQNDFTDRIVQRNILWFSQGHPSLQEVRALRSLLNFESIFDLPSIRKSSDIFQEVFRGFVSTCRPNPREQKDLTLHYVRTIAVMASMHANFSRKGTCCILGKAIRHSSPYALLDKTLLFSFLKLLLGPSVAMKFHRRRHRQLGTIVRLISKEQGKETC